MAAVLLALAASGCWGLADFAGGLKSRTIAVPVVLLLVEGTGLVLVLGVVVATGEPLPDTRAIVASLAAGAAGATALGCFYRALATGTMSVVAPISATGVALPVLVGVLTGDTLSAVVSAGLVLAVAGVLLASREPAAEAARPGGRRARRSSVALALVAACGFGTYFVLSDVAADQSVLWLLVLSRVIALPVLVPLALRAPRPAAANAWPLLVAGALDVTATGLYGLANREGQPEHRRRRRLAVPGHDRPAGPDRPARAPRARAGGGRRRRAGGRRAHRGGLAPRPSRGAYAAGMGEQVLAALQLAPATAAGILYALRVHRLRGTTRAVPGWRQASFYGGLFVQVAGLVALGGLADELFWAHMTEHLLLGDIGALLLVLGLTGPVLSPVLRLPGLRHLTALAHPVVAVVLWAVDLAFWHLPAVQDAAVRHEGLHALQHTAFVGFGVLMWLALLGPLPKPAWFGNAARLGYVIVVRLTGAVLGNVLVFGGRPFYDVYAAGERPRHLRGRRPERGRRGDDGRGLVPDARPAGLGLPPGRARGRGAPGAPRARGEPRRRADEARAARAVAAGRGAELRRRLESG